MERTQISSMKALQERLVLILEELARDHRLALAGLANPILALEDLGYDLAPSVRVALDDRSRFGRKDVAARRELRKRLFELAGRKFDPASEDDLLGVLYDDLQLGTRDQVRRAVVRPGYSPSRRDGDERQSDPLERLKGKHPIVEPLLELRRIDARAAPFASSELYAEIKSGERSFPVTAVRARRAGGDEVLAETRVEA
jgi:hypothetical protein